MLRLELNHEAVTDFKNSKCDELRIDKRIINDTTHIFFSNKFDTCMIYARVENNKSKETIEEVKKIYFDNDKQSKINLLKDRYDRVYKNLNTKIAKNNKELQEYYAIELDTIKETLKSLED